MRARLVAWSLILCAGIAAGAQTAPREPIQSVKGKVLEVKEVESYTYLRLGTRDGEIWAAVGKTPVRTGTEVTVEYATMMENFESRSLNRKFDRILFGSIAGAGSQAAAGKEKAGPHAGAATTASAENIKVAKASGPGASTVADIVSKKAELKDKVVLVRGRVVKFTPEVMGKNWIHLQDGTGSAADGTNDVLVTTADRAALGDVVLIRGVVHTDRDFGSGYAYKVIVEEATIQK